VISDAAISTDDIEVLSITNQRETVVVWDKNTGEPVYNAVVWQCQRGKDICEKLVDTGKLEIVKSKTGLIIDPYFSASGIAWILDNIEGAREKAERGDLVFGTMDSWLIFKLTDGKVHATDHSNACRTMLYNIFDLQWDDEIMNMLNIPVSMAPAVLSSGDSYGLTEPTSECPIKVPIAGVMGDSHAALFGQLCFSPGLAKTTYGTGSSVMMNIGKKALQSPDGLVTSIGFSLNGEIDYVFEGNIHCTGDTIKWLVDNLELIESSASSEVIAKSVEDNGGVYFVPAFAVLGAPYWNNEARAIITGMDRGSSKGHIVRAALESIAYQVKDVVDLMSKGSGIPLKELRVDGGPTSNNFLMQFQADMLNSAINISKIEEGSALGVALMGGLNMGMWKGINELIKLRKEGKIVGPGMDSKNRERLCRGWSEAVSRVL